MNGAVGLIPALHLFHSPPRLCASALNRPRPQATCMTS